MNDLKQLMLRAKLTLAVAESVTCGHLQARIGAISGASNFFLGGITAYTLDQKIKLLGVPCELAEPVNCVSEQVAAAMAQGARTLFASDIGVATTGYAESAPDAAAPYAWIAVADSSHFTTRRIDCPDIPRTAAQEHIASAALDALIEYLNQSLRRSTS